MKSLRGRLTLGLILGIGLLLAAGGWGLNRLIASRLEREFDAALVAEARSLMALTEEHEGRVWLELAYGAMPEYDVWEEPQYFQVWLGDGAVLERSRSLGTHDLPRFEGAQSWPLLRDLELPDGRPGRLAEIRFQPRRGDGEPGRSGGSTVTLAVAHGREDLDAFLVSLRWTLALFVLALAGGTAVLVRLGLAVGLAPLDGLSRRLEAMHAGSLGEPLEASEAPSELQPVIRRLNELLARLQASFETERMFSANLAHELRTPLAELRSLVEVALRWPDDPAATLPEILEEVRGIGLQMERIVANLLALARCDGGQQPVQAAEIGLLETAESCWQSAAREAGERGVAFRLEVPEDLRVVTDGEKLAIILTNLFANAVAYGESGGWVACSAAAAAGGTLELRVANPAGSLAPEDLPHIFDRFWRQDPARSGGRHAGLGLSLVAAFCKLLDLRVEARIEQGVFEITLSGLAGSRL